MKPSEYNPSFAVEEHPHALVVTDGTSDKFSAKEIGGGFDAATVIKHLNDDVVAFLYVVNLAETHIQHWNEASTVFEKIFTQISTLKPTIRTAIIANKMDIANGAIVPLDDDVKKFVRDRLNLTKFASYNVQVFMCCATSLQHPGNEVTKLVGFLREDRSAVTIPARNYRGELPDITGGCIIS